MAGRFGLDRSLVLVAGATLALVIATIVVAFTVGDEEPAEFAAGSPERVIQDFLVAIDQGNIDAAYALLSTEYQRTTSRTQFAQQFGFRAGRSADLVTVDDTDVEGDRAVVTVRVRTVYEDGDDSEYETAVTLLREAGAWRLRIPVSV